MVAFYNAGDQAIYNQGYSFIPQERFRLGDPNLGGSTTTAPVTGGINTLPVNMGGGGGGGGFNPYNPDMSQIRTDFDPTAYNLAMRNEEKFGPTVGPNPDMYFTPQSKLQKAIGSAVNFIPGFGTLKRGAEFVGGILNQFLPVNQRAILENELRGSGVLTDDIGRIVAQPGQYNTPEGIMAGYNAAQMNEGTFDKRLDRISKTLGDKAAGGKYGISASDIQGIIDGTISEEDIENKYGISTNLISNLRNINLAKQNFINQQNKAAEIAAYKEKQKQKKALERQRAKTREADAAAGAFSNQVQQDSGGGGGGGGSWREQTAAKERQGVSVAGPGFGKGAYFMDGGLVDLVDIYD